jgi:CRP-like cAMP-binding protein
MQQIVQKNVPSSLALNIEALKKINFFDDVSNAFLENLLSKASVLHYKKNTIIFLREEEAKNFYFVKRGWVKLFKETLDGTEAVIDVVSSNTIFGEQAIFSDMQYTYSAEVVDDAEIYSIPLSFLKNEIDSNIKFAHSFIKNMAKVQRIKELEIEHKSIQNVPQRIGCFILRLCKEGQQTNVTINLPYDKNLLAARLGIQPETFSRGLSKLREESGVEIKGSSVFIKNINQLTGYCCSACSNNFPCEDIKK